MPLLFLLLAIIIIIAGIWLVPLIKNYQRQKISNQTFPSHWISVLENNVPCYKKLPINLRQKLHKRILVFLAEKQFIGCQGLTITEEIKITVAGNACLLLLSDRSNYYPYLDSILVYPYIFKVKRQQPFQELYLEQEYILSGESWGKQGLIVLAWQQIQNELKNYYSGQNVILHEFAHQLDREDGSMNGVPQLKNNQEYRSWAEVFQKAYQKLSDNIKTGKHSVINAYGATNPAEFFAVATETYFTKPEVLKRQYPHLYQQLKNYYQIL
jgi:Mlc titration factor MtfA (ptsG expression regulator)